MLNENKGFFQEKNIEYENNDKIYYDALCLEMCWCNISRYKNIKHWIIVTISHIISFAISGYA